MSSWQETEMQALREYMGKTSIFRESDENGAYFYRDEEEKLEIQIVPIGDYNFTLTVNGTTTEGAMEVVGDMIVNTMQYWYCNNDPDASAFWKEVFTTSDYDQLSETTKKTLRDILSKDDKKG